MTGDDFDFQREINDVTKKHQELLQKYQIKVQPYRFEAYRGQINTSIPLTHDVIPDPNSRPYWKHVVLTDIEGTMLAKSIAKDACIEFVSENSPAYIKGFSKISEIESGIGDVAQAKERFSKVYEVLENIRNERIRDLIKTTLSQ